MTRQEFQQYLRNNKAVAIGVPFILGLLMVDWFVLKPARLAKELEAKGGVAATTQAATQAATQPAAATKATVAETQKQPLKMPDPISPPSYPTLSATIDTRFAATSVYPYDSGRNIFNRAGDGKMLISEFLPDQAGYVRPEISYHGFFTLGNDRVAILKYANEVLLTKVGATLKSTPFSLRSVLPEKIVISDESETIREFEISLSDHN
ncbi:MAG: hypothetical protein EOM80_00460 [Erysipelotrichia bacterium]|nr:hypothetical protein [Candidatus Riflebacteria bacterium]NCB37214.1 hypothetical protein [Erysipelotrichia bacterium]